MFDKLRQRAKTVELFRLYLCIFGTFNPLQCLHFNVSSKAEVVSDRDYRILLSEL